MIYCTGLSRTGTTSFTDFMRLVGYNIIHYPTETQLFGGLGDGASDIPVAYHYKKLDKMFPKSKFVHLVREDWVDSVEPYFLRKQGRVNQSKAQLELRKNVYGSVDWDRKLYGEAYKRHDDEVRKYFKNRPDDFIVVDIVGGDPTSQLKRFLGIESKIVEYPRSNARKDW